MSTEPRKVDKKVHGGTQNTSTNGAHGGGNKYFQTALGKGFMIQDPRQGHTQSCNIKK